jgi:hypothetical protein
MISRDQLRKVLPKGRSIRNEDYYKHPVLNHDKTFYFFNERLSIEPHHVALVSTELGDYIRTTLRADGIDVRDSWNPEGWFGKAWTDWRNPSKNERNFRGEYLDVLLRTGSDPYSYQLRPECLADVAEILAELRSAA